MIGLLRGKVVEHSSEGRLLVAVGGDAGAIGYLVSVPTRAEYGVLALESMVQLFIHTHVREDQFDLYGFLNRGEKELFLTLLGVNGIGPKLGLGILSRVEPGELIRAVMSEDKISLTQIPGIGKKTAERVVLELGDSFRKKSEAGLFEGIVSAQGRGLPSGAMAAPGRGGSEPAMMRDAKLALVGLGYREQDVAPLLKGAMEAATPPRGVEDLIRSALRQLG